MNKIVAVIILEKEIDVIAKGGTLTSSEIS
jgi:hypothetical protein